MRRRLTRAAVGLVAVLVLAGCNLASHIVVRPDGSGTYSVVVTVEDGTGDAGQALYASVKASAAKSKVPLPVERYSAGKESGAKISYAFRSLADLKAEAARLAAVGSGLGGVDITRDGTGWHFSASSAEGLVRPPGSAAGSPGGIIDPSQLGGLITLSVIVELPGSPAESNATAVTHGTTTSTFTWALPVGREATPLEASTAFVGRQASVQLATDLTPVATSSGHSGLGGRGVALILVAAAVVAAGVGLLIDRRGRLRSAAGSSSG
jgi:hypothetical protein